MADFLSGIDFFVYFTNPNWRESFGRVIAEAIAAGKLVITDPGTAATFGDAVVASDGADVDGIIAASRRPAALCRLRGGGAGEARRRFGRLPSSNG